MHVLDLSRAVWRKSSRSNGSGGACVEVASVGAAIAVRDSKDPDGPKLIFMPGAWEAFTRTVKAGRFDLT
jgi:Domain of unknown function (DUF397)